MARVKIQSFILILILDTICYPLLAHADSNTVSEGLKADNRTTPPSCKPANCYSDRDCAFVTRVAQQADSLHKSLKTELRHQLHLLSPRNSSNPCHIPRRAFDLLNGVRGVNDLLGGSEGPTCVLEMPSDDATCAGTMKLLECAISRLRIAYTKQKSCFFKGNHGAWLSVVQQSDSAAQLLDYSFNNTGQVGNKTNWESVKTKLERLKGSLFGLTYADPSPSGAVQNCWGGICETVANRDSYYDRPLNEIDRKWYTGSESETNGSESESLKMSWTSWAVQALISFFGFHYTLSSAAMNVPNIFGNTTST